MPQEDVKANSKAAIPTEVEEGTEVKPFDTVTIYATAKAVHIAEGKEWEVHPLLAAKLIASGKATEKQVKAK